MPKDVLTNKGLFERLIRLETKLDALSDKNRKSDVKFTYFVLLVIAVEIINVGFNYVILNDHDHLVSVVESFQCLSK